MKRLLLTLLALFVFLSLTFAFVSCGEVTPPQCDEHIDENGDGICDREGCGETLEVDPPIDSGDYFNENGELILYRDGIPTFQFVVGVGPQGDKSITDLAGVLTALSKAEVKTVKATDGGEQDVEIIFGTVSNRGDEYKFDIHTLGLKGYVVKQVGTKIFVVCGSDDLYEEAIEYLEKTVFGIVRTTPPFTDFVMSADKNLENIQDDYDVKDITVDGTSLRGYTITYNNSDATTKTVATDLQNSIYIKSGIWLPAVRYDKLEEGKPYINLVLKDNEGEGGGFYFEVDDDKNVTIECEYKARFKKLAVRFFDEKVFDGKKKGTVNLTDCSADYRNITYEEYGAVGDGVTDDFFAIKAAHDDANANKLIVHATASATYYIGNANKRNSVVVKTNTYWHGCKFIFDDNEIIAYGTGISRDIPIFLVSPDNGMMTYRPDDEKFPLPITSLDKGQGNIGWAPGNASMLVIYNENVRHYIRYGPNNDNGKPQHELIIVDKDGNVDPTTPIQWTYEEITKIERYRVDDTPIEIRGEGEDGKLTKIETRYNNGPAYSLYYERNITITRSNVTLSGIEHYFTDWTPRAEGGKGSPYHGIVRVMTCSNVTIDNMIYESPEVYYAEDSVPGYSAPNGANIGSYDITAECANNITWCNSTQSNFFEPDGSKKGEAIMGTNFCKNLNFDNMYVCAFDAHCGVYNATIRKTTCDHLNFIGAGDIILEDVIVYTGRGNGADNTAINLRYDYGSTWSGDVYVNGLTFRYYGDFIGSNAEKQAPISIIRAEYNNHYFGYTCYLPQHITVKNVVGEQIDHILVGPGDGNTNRQEIHKAYNNTSIYLFSKEVSIDSRDLSSTSFGGTDQKNQNVIVPTVAINYYQNYTGEYANLGIKNKLTLVMPTSPTFNRTEINISTEEEE